MYHVWVEGRPRVLIWLLISVMQGQEHIVKVSVGLKPTLHIDLCVTIDCSLTHSCIAEKAQGTLS